MAVSGGADSFALLHACAQKGLSVVALTVDHGLREGSAEEARTVAAWCEDRDIPHETLRWEGEKPGTGIQAAARKARYRLLLEACVRHRATVLLTGHTADDQAESVFMRLRRGAGRGLSGIPHLAGIARDAAEPIHIARPMLKARRAEAREYASAFALPFVDDASNVDEAFERVRIRALLAALEQQDILTVEALCRTADRIGSLRAGAAWNDPEWTDDGAALVTEPIATAEIFDRIVYAVGGGEAVPSDTSARLFGSSSGPVAGVIARVHDAEAGEWCLFREPAALLGRADGHPGLLPVPAVPGTELLFDRRFIVEVPDDAAPGTELLALGRLVPKEIALSTLARQRIATLPCLAREGRITHLPTASIRAVRDALAGWKRREEFLPSTSKPFRARCLLTERFAGNVIRY